MSTKSRRILPMACLALAMSVAAPSLAQEVRGLHRGPVEAPQGFEPASCAGFDYQQPLEPAFFFAGVADAGVPEQYLAEDFVDAAAQPAVFPGSYVGSARWWGLSTLFATAGGDCAEDGPFVLVLRADNAGLPGAVVSSATVTPTRTDSGLAFPPETIWQYDAILSPPIDATGAAWIEIYREAGTDPACQFLWLNEATAAYDDYFSASVDEVSWTNVGFGDLTVCLDSPPALAIPTLDVAGLALLTGVLVALALLALHRRRRAA